MTTPAVIGAAYTALRGRLTAAQVTFQLRGKTLTGLWASQGFDPKATASGVNTGFQSALHVLNSELPTGGIVDGETLEFTNSDKSVTKRRIQSHEDIGQTVTLINLRDEFDE